MSVVVAAWVSIAFTNRAPFPMYLHVTVTQDGDDISCVSDTIDLEHVDCSKSYLTVVPPSAEGKRFPTERFSLECDQEKNSAHIEIHCD